MLRSSCCRLGISWQNVKDKEGGGTEWACFVFVLCGREEVHLIVQLRLRLLLFTSNCSNRKVSPVTLSRRGRGVRVSTLPHFVARFICTDWQSRQQQRRRRRRRRQRQGGESICCRVVLRTKILKRPVPGPTPFQLVDSHSGLYSPSPPSSGVSRVPVHNPVINTRRINQ